MAEEYNNVNQHNQYVDSETMKSGEAAPVETTDRGIFDFINKKKEEEKPQEEGIVTEFEKVHVSEHVSKEERREEEEKEKKHGLLEKLHRSDSSSSSSDEEEGEDGEKKKKKKEKKGLKEKIKEKLPGREEEERRDQDTAVPVERYEENIHVEEVVPSEPSDPDEKKGFFDKIKEKLPGQNKKPEEVPPPPELECAAAVQEGEGKEKKGILEKIKEKIPGFHPKNEEEKEKEKERAST
ncbi:hypothetical protein Nepgr_006496 [Nepenthes gracilis]|uniref:Dehydrin n=1 Tax=Nepenthes gracilis TaxID=150966 RepID=A0AAD3S5N9_NEPGR|nr:hypothetical protein Nepgr_006496 [Nepenthes gracilis]